MHQLKENYEQAIAQAQLDKLITADWKSPDQFIDSLMVARADALLKLRELGWKHPDETKDAVEQSCANERREIGKWANEQKWEVSNWRWLLKKSVNALLEGERP